MNINLPSYLTLYIDKYRSVKSRAWFILNCVKYIEENNINVYAYYEGMNNEERINKDEPRGKSRS